MKPKALKQENALKDQETLAYRCFDFSWTLEEIEWTRILGPSGFAQALLSAMVELAPPRYALGQLSREQQSSADVFTLQVAGMHTQIRLDYEQPLYATLASATRRVLDPVNQALRRARADRRFVLLREPSSAAASSYRLVMAPTSWLVGLSAQTNSIVGLTPESFEVALPTPASSALLGEASAENTRPSP